MDTWFIIILLLSLYIAAILKSNVFTQKHLLPGPPRLPIIGNLLWLQKPISDMEVIIRGLLPRYGPLIALKFPRRTLVFVASHSLAHEALIQNGTVFANRPGLPPIATLINKPQKTISSSSYGPTWRLLRRNLTQEILHPSCVGTYAASRRRVLSLFIHRLGDTGRTESPVKLIEHFQYAMFCLLVLMCFGDDLEDCQIREIETVQRDLLVGFPILDVLNIWPRLGKIIFRRRWKKYVQLRENQSRVLVPIIRARIEAKNINGVAAYVDTLADLLLPEENRKLEESEIMSLCSEFLTAGIDTTATCLQWTMANLVKNPQIQEKLYREIISVVGPPSRDGKQQVEEEDLEKMAYLKAVVVEGLRRHPPSHLVLPHTVSRDVELNGYVIPKDTMVNFMVADMGWDPEVWENPMEFRPERFVGEAVDIMGSREIKMMPFGAGRRACPAYALAMLHLEYFVANLIWYFEWSGIEGDEVDLSEKQEFTVVMKHPLRARISPRM